ncbi:hypothetical protein KY321_00265 [Candidatus Woesearchaeota archaeon]|nr:hypothetical protein [Candidatus Woesearchaeota archaeon]
MAIKRETAYKVKIKDLIKGKYVVTGETESNYIEIKDKKVSRSNIIGIIITDENNNYSIDDGSGEIVLRDFNEKIPENLNTGDLILLIGKPREYNEDKYIVPEIIKKIDDEKWVEYRKLELNEDGSETSDKNEDSEEIKTKEFNIERPEDILNEIKDIIVANDKGDGTSMQTILEKLNDKTDGEENIKKLLKIGEIYEIKPSVYKIL